MIVKSVKNFFVDGSCARPELRKLRLAAFAVAAVTASGDPNRLCQSIEIYAGLMAVALCPNSLIHCDCPAFVALIQWLVIR